MQIRHLVDQVLAYPLEGGAITGAFEYGFPEPPCPDDFVLMGDFNMRPGRPEYELLTGPPDSVFSVLEVDTAVVRSASSAAPAYPLKLLTAHIMGSVSARYVVDTTGFADTASFEVMKSTNPEFTTAVREALPYMRFTPAKIGSVKVRQLVEQQFSFKITDTATVAPPKKKP